MSAVDAKLEIEFERKYRVINKKLQELQNYRIDSVRADIDDLKKKIGEHRRVHELVVKELRQQNGELRNIIQERQYGCTEVERLRDSNLRLCRTLQMHDSVLNAFLKHPTFRVYVTGKSTYEIRSGNDSLVFTLTASPEHMGSYIFQCIVCPRELARHFGWPQTETGKWPAQIIKPTQLTRLCDTLYSGLRMCSL